MQFESFYLNRYNFLKLSCEVTVAEPLECHLMGGIFQGSYFAAISPTKGWLIAVEVNGWARYKVDKMREVLKSERLM